VRSAQRVDAADYRRLDDFALRVTRPAAVDCSDLEQPVAPLHHRRERLRPHQVRLRDFDAQGFEMRRFGGVAGVAHRRAHVVAARDQQLRDRISNVAVGASDDYTLHALSGGCMNRAR